MDEKQKWSKEKDFATLDAIDEWTDADLKEMGLSEQEIAGYRAWQKKNG